MNTLKIGLIKGRHELPVDDYLIDHEVSGDPRRAEEVQAAVKAGLDRVREVHEARRFDLYLTGLTRAAIFAVCEIERRAHLHQILEVGIWEYDAASGEYTQTIRLGIEAWPTGDYGDYQFFCDSVPYSTEAPIG